MSKINLKKILDFLPNHTFFGNIDTLIESPNNLDTDNIRNDILFWCSDKKIDQLLKVKHGTIICSEKARDLELNKSCNYILVDNPRDSFRKVLEQFFNTDEEEIAISKTAIIHKSVTIGENVSIGEHVIIEKNCSIGNNCKIGHNTVIIKNTKIGNNVIIGHNNTIGGFGFGFVKDENNKWSSIPHIGNVIIEDDVEIANNTIINRAVMGSTILKRNSKVDSLCYIAHGAIIGKNTLIIGNSMICGSTEIGENVWVAPSVTVINKTVVGNNSYLGLGAVVIKPVEENSVVVGNPARNLQKN